MTRGGGPDDDDGIDDVTRAAALRARQRAAQEMPTPDALAEMVAARSGSLSRDEIRHLAAEAIANAQRISYLLGRLAELVDEEDGAGGGP